MAATAAASTPMAGTAVTAGTGAMSLGEPVIGTLGDYGNYHVTQGSVQGVLEIAPPASVGGIIADDSSIRVFPNPVTTTLFVDRPDDSADAYLSIYTDAGQMVLRAILSEAHQGIDVASLTPGIYLLTVNAGSNSQFTTKLIKY